MVIDKIILFQLLSVVLAWAISQLIKILTGYSSIKDKHFWSNSGGMPSSHTACIAAFFFSEIFFHGFTSLSIFSFIVTVLVAVDAMGVRYTTGVNAKVLHEFIKDKKLKEKIVLKNGHTLPQVIVGFILGAVPPAILLLLI